MTVSKKELALDAMVEILGQEGLRALTHARVDRVAGLPKGSTSNYFRTRKALLDGVTAHLAEKERADLGDSTEPPADAEALTEALLAVLEAQSGPFRARTLARYALFVDAAHGGEFLGPLLENRKGFETWTTALLARIGAPDPEGATLFVMAALDGVLLHKLTVAPGIDARREIERVIAACMMP